MLPEDQTILNAHIFPTKTNHPSFDYQSWIPAFAGIGGDLIFTEHFRLPERKNSPEHGSCEGEARYGTRFSRVRASA